MSHHPSSAELAAFRRSIYCDHLSHYPGACRTLDGMHPDSGAYPSELRDGIGRITPGAAHQTLSGVRREASALRSRAYARMAMDAWDPTADADRTWPYGIRVCVHRYAPQIIGDNGKAIEIMECRDCGILASDTWTEDEPRSPLPIRYQPSFIITR